MSRPPNTAARRRQIALGLRRAMARSGFDGASVAEVAAAARVAPGIVHYHFRDKREVLLELLALLGEEHAARLDRAVALARGDPRAELDAFLDVHLATGRQADPEALACWVAACGEAIKAPAVRAAWDRVLGETQGRLVAILERAVAARLARPRGGVEAAAAALLALIQGYLVLAATARSRIPRGSAAGCARAMAEGLLGLSTRRKKDASRRRR